MDSYRAEAEAHGAMIVLGCAVTELARRPDGWHVTARTSAGAPAEIRAAWLVNCAGLDASRIAELAGLDVDALGLRQKPCKGDYFTLAAKYTGLAEHLVYPVPVHAGLGVHITFDLAGRLMAGPDTEYVDELRYDVDPAKAAAFGAARPRPGVVRGGALRRRPRQGRRVRRRAAPLLARDPRRRARPRLRRYPAQAAGPRRAGPRLRDRGGEPPRRAAAGQPDRHRVAGPDLQRGDRRGGRPDHPRLIGGGRICPARRAHRVGRAAQRRSTRVVQGPTVSPSRRRVAWSSTLVGALWIVHTIESASAASPDAKRSEIGVSISAVLPGAMCSSRGCDGTSISGCVSVSLPPFAVTVRSNCRNG